MAEYNPGVIIQARLKSNRFPNKVLCPLLGKPVIRWVIEACERTKLPIIIAIPHSLSNQGIVSYLEEYCDRVNKHYSIYQGPEEDLVSRFRNANESMKFNPIIRVCADSPFVAAEDIKIALEIYNKRKYFTQLNHVQVFGVDELEWVDQHDPFIASREHVVQAMHHTIDYPEDITRIQNEWKDGSPTMDGRKRLWGMLNDKKES